MRWEDVQTVLALARGGTLASAGLALGVVPSTVWRRIVAIEEQHRLRLFDRESWALTEAGEALLPLAEGVEAQMLALERAVAAHDSLPAGTIQVTAAEALLPILTAPLLSFRAQYPTISVRCRFTDTPLDLDRREADVAVRAGIPPQSAAGRRIAEVAWAVYGPRAHTSEDCARLPWAIYGEGLAHLAAVRWQAEALGSSPIEIEVNTVPAMQCVVGTAECRGLLPCFVGDVDARLQRLAGPLPEAASELWVLAHRDLRRTARIRYLIEHLIAALLSVRHRFEGRSAEPP